MAKIRLSGNKNKPIIELVNLVKQFDNKNVLDNMNLSINKGEFVTLLGASGSGKTTALRLIGGFEWPTRGDIKLNGVDMKDLPSYKRPTNTIFQDYALFPHLNVFGNVEYGLKLTRISHKTINQKLEQRKNHLIKHWNKKAEAKIKIIDKKENEYERILNKNNKKSSKYIKARKWLDDIDFKYSYWETYVDVKKNSFDKKYTTRKLSKKERKKQVNEMIALVGLEGNEHKNINELSGGMKQRVALARALVTKPQILLLDEPLSALDLKVRQKMQRELKEIQRKLKITFIFVTHDQEEAMTISDKIAIMRNGKIEQFDKPQVIYEFPSNSWVANFIGDSNIFDGEVVSKNKIKFLNKVLPGDTYKFRKGKKIKVMIRPEDVTITKGKGFISGQIITKSFKGTFWEYGVKTDSGVWKAKTIKKFDVKDKVNFKWTSYEVHSMEV